MGSRIIEELIGQIGRPGALVELWRDEQGTTSVEYAMVLAVVVMGSAAAWQSLTESMVRALASVMHRADGSEGAAP